MLQFDGIPLPIAMALTALALLSGMYFARTRPDLAWDLINWIQRNPRKAAMFLGAILLVGLIARMLRAILL